MCCQEGRNTKTQRWGASSENERIRVYDLDTRQWIDTRRTSPFQGAHEHWAPGARRIYAHTYLHDVHAITRIDVQPPRNEWFFCPPRTGTSHHVTVAPNERFLVGDGVNFDRAGMTAELRQRIEAIAARGDDRSTWVRGSLRHPDGAETIWKYELPEETLTDYAAYAAAGDRLHTDLETDPGRAIRVTPLCRFRSLARTRMFGRRLESNAHVTPDSRWVVFQSSSEDDWFEVWAAEVPSS
jgi:hypothetical protein